MQVCTVCGVEKELDNYYPNIKRCKSCIAEKGREYRDFKAKGGVVRAKVGNKKYSTAVVRRRNWLVSRANHYSVPFGMTYPFIERAADITICTYCKRLRNQKLSFTFDRKVPALGYVDSNIVVACIDCNRLKSDKFTYDEMLIIGAAYGGVYRERECSVGVVQRGE